MRSSSHLIDPPIQVPIKVQHREAKRRNRRRRVDFECGCSYYLFINRHTHGFTHRGANPCSPSREPRIYLEGSKSPLFPNHQPRQPSFHEEWDNTHNQGPVSTQHSGNSGTAQVFLNPSNLDDLKPPDWSFLKGIQNPSPQISEQSRCNFN
nr:transcription activator protein [Cotton leaf curl Rajasthan virus]